MIKPCLTIYFLLSLILSEGKNDTSPISREDKQIEKTSESAPCAFTSDYKFDYRSTLHVNLLDTTDCVFKIFFNEPNSVFIESVAKKCNYQASVLPFNSIMEIAKYDTSLICESYFNRLIGLEYAKYYKSGRIESSGFLIGKFAKERIGKWKYFSDCGKLDSIVDYSRGQIMNFCDFYEIAHAFGMVGKNSKMPNRQRYFEIADSLGLRHDDTNYKYATPYWSKYEFYPISKEEENRKFTSKFRYACDSHFQEWIVEKIFRIENKSFIFYLTVFPKTKGIMIYEYQDEIKN